MVGGVSVDGDFGRFTAALDEPCFADGSVSYQTRHGVWLSLDWDGPFLVDGRPADFTADGRAVEPLHLDNPLIRLPFGAKEMAIGDGAQRHVIDLRHGRPVP